MAVISLVYLEAFVSVGSGTNGFSVFVCGLHITTKKRRSKRMTNGKRTDEDKEEQLYRGTKVCTNNFSDIIDIRNAIVASDPLGRI